MQAKELFHAGRLGDALRGQIDVVREHPEDVDARYLLFVLLCFAGELERAGAALNAIASQAELLETETALLRSLLAAEQERTRAWNAEGAPLVGDDPPLHVQARLRALAAAGRGDRDLLAKSLDEAAEHVPQSRGTLDGTPFTAVRDDDDVLGSVLEVFAGARYVWVGLERIRSLELDPPTRPLDLLWAPARLATHDGIEAMVFVPVLYQGSYRDPSDAVRLGRHTTWLDLGHDVHRGAGQRMLRSAHEGVEREWPLLEIRRFTSGLDEAA